MKRADFLALVLSSVVFLKEKATPEELAKLGEISKPNHQDGCILGQMTGHYTSDRAKEISQKIVHIDNQKGRELDANGEILQLNPYTWFGSSPRFTENYLKIISTESREEEAVAPFEIFILMDGANTKELVAFLKGEADSFEPTFNELEVPAEA